MIFYYVKGEETDKKFQEMWDKQNEYYGNIYEIYVYKTIITDLK